VEYKLVHRNVHLLYPINMSLPNFRCLNKGKTFLHCVEAVHLQRQDLSPPSQICRSSLRLSPAAPLAPIRKLGGKGTIHSSSSSRKSSQNPVALSAPPQTSGFSSLPPPHSHRLELGGDSGRVPSSGVGRGWGGGRAGLGGAAVRSSTTAAARSSVVRGSAGGAQRRRRRMVNWNSTGRLLTTFVDLGFQLGKLLDSAPAMVLASRSGSCKLGMGFGMRLGSASGQA
jgi:hypothetical protein